MSSEITIDNRSVKIHLSKAAEKALSQRTTPLFVEMELYFSCLIRKQVLFHDTQRQENSVAVDDNLSVSFHPVMTASCMIKDAEPEPVKSDFEMQRRDCFVPKWLNLDFKKDSWIGEFGYGK
ncbi:MAG: hypothetical protein KAU21_11660 [Gammaproteobacteria bacterium]|nr:hypothetical protein [Gammaproteobacteria bacterium]